MNILIPTDLSEASLHKLPSIIRLFQGKAVTITLFHAVEPLKSGSALVLNVDDIIYDEAKVQLNTFVEEMNRFFATDDGVVKSDIMSGYFEPSLNRILKATKPDLVIMNSKSRKGIDKILERKKSLQFIGEIKQPLLIIPNETDIEEIKRIGVAVDEKEPLKNDTIDKIEKLATSLSAELKFFHISSPVDKDSSFYTNDMKTSIKGEIAVLTHPEVPIGIEEWMNENQAEVLTMITHDKNFFTRLFSTGMTRIMAKRNSNLLLIITQ